ncbi:MAG: arylsulfatase [Candidatus Poribacteria bacterium]|nr:MAG: arylsulfatase [Candidatus Poribacteria bacterium]
MRPNLLFFFPDQHRYDFVGWNSELPVRTPNLSRLSERGVRFSVAFTPSPLCAPARACLASGRWYEHCGVRDNSDDYPSTLPTFYQRLQAAGYRVGGVGKFDLNKGSNDWGLDGKNHLEEWGFTDGINSEGKHAGVNTGAESPRGPYMKYLHDRGLAQLYAEDLRKRHHYRDVHPSPLPEEAYGDNWVAQNGLELLRGFPTDRPWFLQVNFPGPHEPMDVTAEMRRRWEGVPFPPPHDNDQWDVQTHSAIRQNYAAMIENIDRHLGRYLDLIQERGELERTVIVYSSDHGEMLGDHNRWAKSSYYHPSIGVPLVLAGPGIASGLVSEALVSLHDLAATFLELAGAEPIAGWDARSLLPVLRGERSQHRAAVLSGLNRWRAVFDGRYKLVLREEAAPLLFDLKEDPKEDHNQAADRPEEVERLYRWRQAILSGAEPEPIP